MLALGRGTRARRSGKQKHGKSIRREGGRNGDGVAEFCGREWRKGMGMLLNVALVGARRVWDVGVCDTKNRQSYKIETLIPVIRQAPNHAKPNSHRLSCSDSCDTHVSLHSHVNTPLLNY